METLKEKVEGFGGDIDLWPYPKVEYEPKQDPSPRSAYGGDIDLVDFNLQVTE